MLALALRIELVVEYHVVPVDGAQYHLLSQQLIREGRFAFSSDKPPTFSRMPGYPLFLAYLAVRKPVGTARYSLRATLANAILDVGTAALTAGILYEIGAAIWVQVLGFSMVIGWPLLFILASHTLSETLATFLTTLTVYAMLRAGREDLGRKTLVWAAVVGATIALGALVRLDAIVLVPAAAVLLWRVGRIPALATAGLVGAICFAPWPIRNFVRFGIVQFGSAQWREAESGEPLPSGPLKWARTWASTAHDDYDFDPAFAFSINLPKPIPQMYDSEDERGLVQALFDRYDRERLTPAVDAEFSALGRERARRAPFRTYVWLPLLRINGMWRSVSGSELTMRSRIFHLPEFRWAVKWLDRGLYALAALGTIFLFRRMKIVAAALLSVVVVRSLVLGYTVPLGLSQRFLAEIFPLLIAMAALAIAGLRERKRSL